MLKRFASLGLAASLLLTGAPAIAGWNGAEWGMTPQEVETATNGFAWVTGTRLPRDGSPLRIRNRADFESELSNFSVEYRHDHLGLAQIKLIPEFDDCEDVMRSFIDSFGQPEYQEQIILRTFVWTDEENDNRIVLLHSSADICTFTFTSLSRFNERQVEAD